MKMTLKTLARLKAPVEKDDLQSPITEIVLKQVFVGCIHRRRTLNAAGDGELIVLRRESGRKVREVPCAFYDHDEVPLSSLREYVAQFGIEVRRSSAVSVTRTEERLPRPISVVEQRQLAILDEIKAKGYEATALPCYCKGRSSIRR